MAIQVTGVSAKVDGDNIVVALSVEGFGVREYSVDEVEAFIRDALGGEGSNLEVSIMGSGDAISARCTLSLSREKYSADQAEAFVRSAVVEQIGKDRTANAGALASMTPVERQMAAQLGVRPAIWLMHNQRQDAGAIAAMTPADREIARQCGVSPELFQKYNQKR